MDRGWAPERWKGAEKFCRTINNHGWQHTGEGNPEAKKRNRKQLRESNLEKQRGNNRKKSKGKKDHDKAKWVRWGMEKRKRREGKRGPSSNKINLSESFWLGSSEHQSRTRHYTYLQYEQLRWKCIWASVLVTKATNECRGGLPKTTLTPQRQKNNPCFERLLMCSFGFLKG